ncbi:MAG: hypothetical protein H7296_05135 [Bacteroidia bacterium]|nr:hypothetical protein [Bacteroidia bacterium]
MKITITLLLTMLCLTLVAQIKKGDVFVTVKLQGKGSFSQSNYNNNNTYLTPGLKIAAGVFINAHHAMGLGLTGSYNGTETYPIITIILLVLGSAIGMYIPLPTFEDFPGIMKQITEKVNITQPDLHKITMPQYSNIH